MLYMVGKIFLQRISFAIVYNESAHEYMKNVEYLFSFSAEKISIFLKQRWRGRKHQVLCCHTHIYLSNRTLQIQLISQKTAELIIYFCWIITPTANFIGQLSHILTNNLNLKGPMQQIYVYMMTQCCWNAFISVN